MSALADVSVCDGMLGSGVGRRVGNILFTQIKFYSDEKQIRFFFFLNCFRVLTRSHEAVL